jgi:hypothetical protein
MDIPDSGDDISLPDGECGLTGKPTSREDTCPFFEARGEHHLHKTEEDLKREGTKH